MNKGRYRHIFFDLDHTLWDFDRSSLETMKEIYSGFGLEQHGVTSFDLFLEAYHTHNKELWSIYRDGKIEKHVLNVRRFELALSGFGISDLLLAANIAEYYITRSPLNAFFYPFVPEILEYLFPYYRLHVITNGFEEVQRVKVNRSFLIDYVDCLITSEEAGYKKPDIRIFDYALKKAGALPQESIMIGDDPVVDVEGARNAGMDQVLFNPEGLGHDSHPTFEIRSLLELKDIL